MYPENTKILQSLLGLKVSDSLYRKLHRALDRVVPIGYQLRSSTETHSLPRGLSPGYTKVSGSRLGRALARCSFVPVCRMVDDGLDCRVQVPSSGNKWLGSLDLISSTSMIVSDTHVIVHKVPVSLSIVDLDIFEVVVGGKHGVK